jgi:putative membrane protein
MGRELFIVLMRLMRYNATPDPWECALAQQERRKNMNQENTKPGIPNLASDRSLLAKYRTQLALDRTTLAWIRTTLTMATFGFGMVGFFRSLREKSMTPESIHLHENAIRFGKSLIIIGLVATLLAGISHWQTLRRLRRNEALVLTRWPLSITIAMLLVIIGLVSLWNLPKP